MAYQTPKTDWNEDYEPSPEDMNRIEANIKNIKSETTDFDGDKTFNGDVDITGNISASAATFDTVNTGQGANELYDMNQDVKTSDSPSFANLTLTNDLTVGGNIKPTTSPDTVSGTKSSSPALIIPERGLVQVYIAKGTTTLAVLQVYINGAWENVLIRAGSTDEQEVALVVSTGSNVRILGDPGVVYAYEVY